MAEIRAGWKKVYEIYPARNFWKGCLKPALLLAISILALAIGEIPSLELLKMVCGLIASGFPSIIGFILTGHALIIGFSGSDFLLKLAKSKADDKHSLFERVNSTFAFVIAMLIVTYIMAIIVRFVEGQQINWPFPEGCHTFNTTVLIVTLFMFYYSVCSLLDVVINVFNLGQLAHAIAQNKLRLQESAAVEEAKTDEGFKGEQSFLSRILEWLTTPHTN